MIGWCELRGDFRNFRTDRISRMAFLEETYPTRARQLRRQWWAQEKARMDAKASSPPS
jgi:predicted DNA-binding transcriptional regulator YafY